MALSDDLTPSLSYTPSLPHTRPTTLLTHLLLPPNCTVRIHTPFLKQFLQYNEHLPDASRGFELTAAVLFPIPSTQEGEEEQVVVPPKIHTTNLLVDLAVPDFSMPYNVIIMSSTVIALFFGRWVLFSPPLSLSLRDSNLESKRSSHPFSSLSSTASSIP